MTNGLAGQNFLETAAADTEPPAEAVQTLLEAALANVHPGGGAAQSLVEANAANANPPALGVQVFFECVISTHLPRPVRRQASFFFDRTPGWFPSSVYQIRRRRKPPPAPTAMPVRVTQAMLEVLYPFTDVELPSIRFFDLVLGTLTQQARQQVPAGITGLAQTGETVWALNTQSPYMYRFGAPFTITPILQGWVGIYNGSTFASAVPGIEHMPSALAWDAEGNVWAATTENDLYQISIEGIVLQQTVVPPYATQASGVPLGISSMTWFTDGNLYAASAFNGLLAIVSGGA